MTLRLQLSRRKGFKLQQLSIGLNGLSAVNVSRPSVFGNPFTRDAACEAGYFDGKKRTLDNLFLRDSFAQWIGFHGINETPWLWDGEESDRRRGEMLKRLPSLKGKNLACWCRPGEACHADILLAMAGSICEEVM
jgi:hypothetical protein